MNDKEKNQITNETRFEDEYNEFISEIEIEISGLVRKMVTTYHEDKKYDDGLKFNLGNDLDIAIEEHLLRTGFVNNVRKVLDDVDDQKSYY